MNRTALIIGGSGGIGSAVCKALADSGVNIICGFYMAEQEADHIVQQITASGRHAASMKIDFAGRDSDDLDKICENIFARFGSLDILVNCAAINLESAAPALDDDCWQKVLDVNLTGAFRITRASVKYMMMNHWGRIIHLSSISAHFGGRGQINYASAKSGLEAMVRVFALELGRKGITVNGVAPGVITTRMSERVIDEHQDKMLENISVKRFGKPDEVAAVIAFLASDAASYINGQTIRVDGGMGL